MNFIDRRKMFEDEPWQQGYLLITSKTRNWSQEKKERVDAEERKRLYARFSPDDEGRSRILLYVFKFAENCRKAAKMHNENLEASKAL